MKDKEGAVAQTMIAAMLADFYELIMSVGLFEPWHAGVLSTTLTVLSSIFLTLISYRTKTFVYLLWMSAVLFNGIGNSIRASMLYRDNVQTPAQGQRRIERENAPLRQAPGA